MTFEVLNIDILHSWQTLKVMNRYDLLTSY